MAQTHEFNPTILREYDVRGVVGQTLHAADARALGKAFGSIVAAEGGRRIAVGRDGRLSSPALSKALIEGVTSAGIDVCDIGLGPTPMLYFAVHHLETDGGIQLTGSHNPRDHNGFKMMIGKRSFFGARIQELGQIAQSGSWRDGSGSVERQDISNAYIDRLLQDFNGRTAIDVVWDAGNGAAGQVLQRLADGIPGRQELLFAEVDGNFPNHHPDPTEPENLEDVIAAVKAGNFDLGIAFDGDGDRIGVVDKHGRIVWGDQLLQFLAADILPAYPEGTIIADVKASNTLFNKIEELGGTPLIFKTGHSLIKEKMIETGSPLSGEMSGHIFYKDKFFGHDDGLYVAVRLLDILSRNRTSISDFMDTLPNVHNTPEIRIDCTDEYKFEAIAKLKNILDTAGATYSDIDGVRVSESDGWWLLRASNTQPVLVARVESTSEAGVERMRGQINDHLESLQIDVRI